MHAKLLAGTLEPGCYIAPGAARGWVALQARLVDRIKRCALRQLHASRAGEVLILRVYLAGELATELELHSEFARDAAPSLQRQIEHHLADEQRHADAFTAELAERGADTNPHPPDIISRWKIARWKQIALRYSARLSHGQVAAAFVTALCAEQMAARVLERHCALLPADHPLAPLLKRVLADEQRHVRLCGETLVRIVPPPEYGVLAAMLDEVRRVERAFGITGALGMLAAGLWLRVRSPRP